MLIVPTSQLIVDNVLGNFLNKDSNYEYDSFISFTVLVLESYKFIGIDTKEE